MECYGGYLPLGGKCKEKNPLCKESNPNNGDCSSCWQGYTLVGGNCVVESISVVGPSQSGDVYCVKQLNGACIECSKGYYLNQASGKCTQVDPTCKTYNGSNGDCTSCYQGYSLNSVNRCVTEVVIYIANCASVNPNGQCTACSDRYYLTGNTCTAVSILCTTYNPSNGQCTGCIGGHFLQGAGECIYPALYDDNCIYYESAYCSQCKTGYFINNYMCQMVDRNCLSFDYKTKTCSQCTNGRYPQGFNCL